MHQRISTTPMILTGPLRVPVQMLAGQRHNGQLGVHDAEVARSLGLAGAPIEAPTHFSQFEPLLAAVWGPQWAVTGTISAHFQTMVFEGEEVRAVVELDGPGATSCRLRAEKADGTPVLEGTGSIDGDHAATMLAARVARARSEPPTDLSIVDNLTLGPAGPVGETTRLTLDSDNGEMYPFTLREKLAHITEHLTWHDPGSNADNPWGRAVVPFEMLSVMTFAGANAAGLHARQPSSGLFIDLEVRMLAGPVFVDQTYRVDREVVAFGSSRRTESFWTLTTLTDDDTGVPTAQVLLHQGVFRDSFAPGT
jgi:hypothetical protein